ncbi:MAG: biopolymer transporter ExbD [Treponema sp.]|nr:biopolymer transporter ExbD [Treponema sp.]
MKLTRPKRKKFDDSSASSDIAFLLIIYFIVIAAFNINKGFIVNLPAKDSTRMILKEDLLRFNMDENGNLLFNEDSIGFTEAEGVISAAQSANPNIAVMLTIDPLAGWQSVVTFVELAQDLNIDSFSFSMKKELQ